jgi:hypothetical protein
VRKADSACTKCRSEREASPGDRVTRKGLAAAGSDNRSALSADSLTCRRESSDSHVVQTGGGEGEEEDDDGDS